MKVKFKFYCDFFILLSISNPQNFIEVLADLLIFNIIRVYNNDHRTILVLF